MTTPGNRRSSDVVSRSPSLNYRSRLRNSFTYRYRKSARKSLCFDNAPTSSKRRSQGGEAPNLHCFDATFGTSASPRKEYDNADPPDRNFWTSPPPPLPLMEDDGTSLNRRSLRLRTKNQFALAQISDSQSPTLRAAGPTSDQLLRNKTLDVGFNVTSVHSDYGTASENSLYFHPSQISSFPCSNTNVISDSPLSRTLTQPRQNSSSDPSCSQSIGYASDLDDCLSNLSIDDANKCSQPSKQWDSDDDDPGEDKLSTWEDISETGSVHMSLHDLNLKKLRAYLIRYNDINVLVPLDGFEIQRPTSQQIDRRSHHITTRRAIQYDLRKRPNPQLENLLKVQVFSSINIEKYFLQEGLRITQVSPIISIQPHEVKFCSLYPAIVQIPLKTHPSVGDEVHCLYSRYSTANLEKDVSNISWKSVEAGKFSIMDGRANFETYDFGLFVLIIRQKCQCGRKTIRARVGGKLLINDSPSVEVLFPKEATEQDSIEASAHIYLDTEESVSEVLTRKALRIENQSNPSSEISCLATPIIQLEPHGIRFLSEPVMVTLPIPDYEEILATYKSKFSIWHSSTALNEPSKWQKLEVDYKISQLKKGTESTMVVTFPVNHFSFFKGVWDTISTYLYDAKIGMMYYFISFPMKCQANMEEYIHDKDKDNPERRFGLEVSMFQADKQQPQMSTYKYKVGQSNPKLVKPGKLSVKLKSQYFGADVDAGEEEDLVKEESDFRGRDFEKQFACKFKPEHNIERGPFGKVLVTRHVSPRQTEHLIFEFNIQKHGNETDIAPSESRIDEDKWSLVALTELANSLYITEGENWKCFAKEIGMTKQEIKDAKLKSETDPLHKIVAHYQQRGGTASEFVNAIYRCHRTLKINGGFSPESKQSRSSNESSGRGSLSSNNARFNRYGSQDSDTSGTQSQDSGILQGRKRSHVQRSSGNGSMTSSKLSKRRRLSEKPPGTLNSDADTERSDTDTDHVPGPSTYRPPIIVSHNSASASIASTHTDSLQLRNDNTKLESGFLWEISKHLTSANWKAIGRSLGLEENVLVDVEHAYRSTGFRECAYQMLLHWRQQFPSRATFGTLYTALSTEGMNPAAAKQMINIHHNS